MTFFWPETAGRRRYGFRTFVPLAWLLALVGPAADVLTGRIAYPLLAGAGLLVFVALLAAVAYSVLGRWQWLGRWRAAMLAPSTVLALVLTWAYGDSWGLTFLFLAAGCALAFTSPRQAAAAVAGTVVLAASATWLSGHPGAVVSSVVTVALAGLVVLAFRGMGTAIMELRAAREELARLAVDQERARFARDLHDLLGHTMSLVVIKAEVVRRLVHTDPDQAALQAADIETVGRQALTEIREAVTGYRPRDLDAELTHARSALADAGIEMSISESAEELPEAARSLLGWCVREAVTNVIRHSHARKCTISLRVRDGIAELQVRDDGAGGAVGSAGTGLRGLAERLSAAGGRVDAGPVPDGFTLTATLPVRP
ncbi:sensor histidine kinase [Fodinicola feengrottensis]|uniref:Sensor histidine kinase n=1 Tax=Fodinicola feengrottensis TaxID=435914 RepID=A0ABN2IBR8_9ACTN